MKAALEQRGKERAQNVVGPTVIVSHVASLTSSTTALYFSLTLLPIDGSVSDRGLSICEETLSVPDNSSRRPVCFVSSYKGPV